MMRAVFVSRRFSLAAVAVALTTIAVLALPSRRAPASAGGRARLAVLATRGDTTEVRVVEVDVGGPLALAHAEVAARIEHVADGTVRGAVVDATTLLVAVEEDTGRDRSYSGALYLIDLGTHGSTTRLPIERLAYASTPMVAGRSAFLQTGHAGLARDPRRMRDDELTITQLDLDTGHTEEVLALRGQLAYPVGVSEDTHELVAYLLGPPGTIGDGGRLAAVQLAATNGPVRDLGRIGTARDLSLATLATGLSHAAGPAVIFESRDEDGARAVFALALAGGSARERLVRGAAAPLSPLVATDGVLHTNLLTTFASPTHALDVTRVLAPMRAPTHGLALVQRHLPNDPLPQLLVRDRASVLVLPQARGERLEPVGFLVTR